MIDLDIKECTGCGACVQKCPKSCIQWEQAELGFLYPKIDEARCIQCGTCKSVCPLSKKIEKTQEPKAYAVIQRNDKLLTNSTSGGAFSAIAEWVLAKAGIIYGCAYNERLSPVTIKIDSVDDLWKLQGSKYVQCSTEKSYISAQKDLESGKYVLYTGTPCQIAGLKSYLGRVYPNLLCADLICHGVPSAKYFFDYVCNLEKKIEGKIDSFCFRDKRSKGWGLSGTYSGTYLKNGKRFIKKLVYFKSYYYAYFLEGETYRRSCYSCKYANTARMGDFTLGDLWGAEGMNLSFSTKGGCSLVLVNTKKAETILKELNIEYQEIPLEKAIENNHQLKAPVERPLQRSKRAEEYEQGCIEEITKEFVRSHRKSNLISRIKYCVPVPIRRGLLKLRYSKNK